jgi:diketogulonate reductase-like aldo/keto reductase
MSEGDASNTGMAALPSRVAHDGLTLPAIGFGAASVKGFAGCEAIVSALRGGYRLIDSAVNYENEGIVGRAIRESGVPREEVIITTKLPGRCHPYAKARECIEESASRLGVDYIDLYLIHWPNPTQAEYIEAWQALVDAQKDGLIKHIGVSNFLPGHIDMLIRATGVTPSVNQIERSPYFQRHDLMDYDDAHGIITEAWSPIGRANQMLHDPDVTAIAERHGLTPAQVILAWHVATGDVAIPKSMNPDRQRANIDLAAAVAALDGDDMARLATLDNPQGSAFGLDPRWHEEN